MKITFAPGLNGSPWPPITAGRAAFGEAVLGPSGLLDLLETATGLGGPRPSGLLRAAPLLAALRADDGFWTASLAHDPFGVAEALAGWIDQLEEAGWAGQGSGRLAQLAGVRGALPDGLGRRLDAVRRHLGPSPLSDLRLLEPRDELSAAWAGVVDALEAGGCLVREEPPGETPAAGDLRAARLPGFTPAGDGTLQLLRPSGPLRAADDLAAWIAVHPDEELVVIGADVLLDQALRRHGLPTSGATEPSDNVLLQVLPLVVRLDHPAPDPQTALELVTLPVGPVPRSLGRRLARALQEQPAVGGPAWRDARDAGLATIEDEGRRERVAARLRSIFEAGPEAMTAPRLVERAGLVAAWLRGRRVMEDKAQRPTESWDAALSQCAALQAIADASGLEEVSGASVARLLREATEAASPVERRPAEAGLGFVAAPEAIVGPARRVLWWGFERDAAPGVIRSPFRASERAQLADVGVLLPDPGALAHRLSARWARPLALSAERLILCCPTVGVDGGALEPHPLWDEVQARTAEGASLRALIATAADVGREASVALPLPAPRRTWAVQPGRVARRAQESPSSLELLLGCAFAWGLRYSGKLRGGSTARLTVDERLLGSLVHELVARVLEEGPWKRHTDAGRRIVELFDQEGPQLAAALFQPGARALHAKARLAAQRAMEVLQHQLNGAGLRPIRVEQERTATTSVGLMAGTADLVAGPETTIIDLKWGGQTYRRDLLRQGGALQLAAYAQLEGSAGGSPDVAYFILKDQRMLASSPRLPGAEPVGGPTPQEVWLGAERAWREAWRTIAGGELLARGVADEDEDPTKESALGDDGLLRIKPSCGFCELGALCGKGVSR